MNSYFYSSVFRKTLATLSGFFLIVFLFGHLAGNLQLVLLSGDVAQKQFNEYALFMTSNPAVKILSYLTYASILLHAALTLFLAIQSKKARPIDYEVSAGSANSSWASRNMPMLGILVMLFILIHMKSFWYEMHFGTIGNDPWGHKDLYTMTVVAFQKWWYTAFYVISMVILGFHLRHGVESGFQTLGLKTRKYIGPIQTISQTIAILIPAAFAIIPIILHLQS
ncbi:MAG: succinate dehydrogenase cytochrome b subunit [Candidatus Marinimicrobia bacterium]|jgi:succinate dehydrogenase / fumarate reductase cytochrome b subunit|nr:succinate dehydrogenase cytochrome b subunit [Candidatus Neomarinimicrobiota bacterium]MBT3838374.1 succinate dehydrogenase cytochrome b subunit [Candidatus Neomarinimicrobiota bacterium]MBT3998679.1 succinate dehydrogenase cytochrome b subunit [Candidatus Neomarinimicrobiota bacterium]MBT4283258.1 succinate dehydrogenase cytochrome b subunit [Candidatus Neomarinimicrobiota bacterium]MBT4578429.1 succinate dehydrogenase cytochrome b subunit [Candidatus Neomarinimicrobiota bacterium]